MSNQDQEPAVEQAKGQGFLEGLRLFLELNPVLIRGILTSIAALIVSFLGRELITDSQVEAAVQTFVAIAALFAALWSRNKVIAENKVVAWKPNPENDVVMPGPSATDIELLEDSAVLTMDQKEVRQVLRGDV